MTAPVQRSCFVEADPSLALPRRAAVELVGTLLLTVAAIGSGLAMARLQPVSPAIGLLAGALATSGALVGLIQALGNVSGGHFNPLITLLQYFGGARPLGCTIAYVAGQAAGAVAGALLTNLIFATARGSISLPSGSSALALSEAVAAAGLMIVVFGCMRSFRAETGPFAVGAWLTAAIIGTPSTSYANPAIALAAAFAAGPVALPGWTALLYAAMELAGALVALVTIAIFYPAQDTDAP
jgi:glycerol uptake facilitator-like aquaporin